MNKRVLGVGAGLAGIAALLFGLQSKQWVVGTDYGIETHVGLRVMELCQVVVPEPGMPGEEVCTAVTHAENAQSPSKLDGFDTFSLLSHVTFYTGLVAVGVLLIVILLAMVGRFPTPRSRRQPSPSCSASPPSCSYPSRSPSIPGRRSAGGPDIRSFWRGEARRSVSSRPSCSAACARPSRTPGDRRGRALRPVRRRAGRRRRCDRSERWGEGPVREPSRRP